MRGLIAGALQLLLEADKPQAETLRLGPPELCLVRGNQEPDEDQNLRLRLSPHSRGRPKLASFRPKPLEALPDTM